MGRMQAEYQINLSRLVERKLFGLDTPPYWAGWRRELSGWTPRPIGQGGGESCWVGHPALLGRVERKVVGLDTPTYWAGWRRELSGWTPRPIGQGGEESC